MITKLTLRNFLSYEYASIPIGPMTVILGENNSGKTTLLRALKWCLLNEGSWSDDPYKDSIRRQLPDGSLSQEVSVTAEFDTGLTIERKRSTTQNLYIVYQDGVQLYEIGGKGSSIGKGYCEDIANLTGIKQITWPDKTNTYPQFSNDAAEGRFLLRDGSASIDSKLGAILGLNTIEAATKLASTYSISKGKQVSALEKEVLSLEDQMKQYDGLDEAIVAQEQHMLLLVARNEHKNKVEAVTKVLNNLSIVQEVLNNSILIIPTITLHDICNQALVHRYNVNQSMYSASQAITRLNALPSVDTALVADCSQKVNEVRQLLTVVEKAKATQAQVHRLAYLVLTQQQPPVAPESILSAVVGVRAHVEKADDCRAIQGRVSSVVKLLDNVNNIVVNRFEEGTKLSAQLTELKSSVSMCPVDEQWVCQHINKGINL